MKSKSKVYNLIINYNILREKKTDNPKLQQLYEEKKKLIKRKALNLYLNSLKHSDYLNYQIINSLVIDRINTIEDLTGCIVSETRIENYFLRDNDGFYAKEKENDWVIEKHKNKFDQLHHYLQEKEEMMDGSKLKDSKLTKEEIYWLVDFLGYGKKRQEELKNNTQVGKIIKFKGKNL